MLSPLTRLSSEGHRRGVSTAAPFERGVVIDDHEDRSGFEAVKELFHFHAAHEDVYRGLRPVADIALVRRGGSEYRGWFRFLVEHHFLFDVLRPEVLLERPAVAGPKSGTPPWEKYRALVLPDLECVGDELAAKIDRFVEAGGALIATGRSGLRDDDDEPRERPAMACLGVPYIRRLQRPPIAVAWGNALLQAVATCVASGGSSGAFRRRRM